MRAERKHGDDGTKFATGLVDGQSAAGTGARLRLPRARAILRLPCARGALRLHRDAPPRRQDGGVYSGAAARGADVSARSPPLRLRVAPPSSGRSTPLFCVKQGRGPPPPRSVEARIKDGRSGTLPKAEG